MELSHIVEGGNRFACDLYQQFRSREGNLFYSPASIATALAMTYAGAAGKTKVEMARTLHFSAPNGSIHLQMHALQRSWGASGEPGVRLHLANRLWGQEKLEFLPDFLEITRDKYGAELARLDFVQTEAARRTINSWVAEQTEGRIQELVPAGLLSPATLLVLTNAIYFHGSWTEPFPEKLTRDQDFHVTARDRVTVRMMHRSDRLGYAALDDLQLLELPYGNGGLSMIVLLPRAIDGLAKLEAKITHENLQGWTAKLAPGVKVDVSLPKFRTTSQFELSKVLSRLGMPSAFAEAADFSGMTGGNEVFISDVVHQAFVDVNEQGTEAAAAVATVARAMLSAESREPPVFQADHPFLFLIKDNHSGAVLFVGRVLNPLE